MSYFLDTKIPNQPILKHLQYSDVKLTAHFANQLGFIPVYQTFDDPFIFLFFFFLFFVGGEGKALYMGGRLSIICLPKYIKPSMGN